MAYTHPLCIEDREPILDIQPLRLKSYPQQTYFNARKAAFMRTSKHGCGDDFGAIVRSEAANKRHRRAVMRSPPSFDKVTKDCECCGVSVTRSPSLMKTFRFCSIECRRAGQRASRICDNCGNEFSRPVSQMVESAQFCSKACYDEAQTTGEREKFICECCCKPFARKKSWNPGLPRRFCSDACSRKTMIREEHPRWKGGVSVDSDGEEITLMPRENIVSQYIRTHRKIASESIGRLLERYEHVIHINNRHDDHRPENLFICGSVNECLRRINGSLPWPSTSNLKTYK